MAFATLTWYPSTGTVDGYKIYADTTSHSGQPANLYDALGSPKDVGNVTTGTFELNGVNGAWYFVITAYNSFGEGGPSAEVTGSFYELGSGTATVGTPAAIASTNTFLRPRTTLRFA
jgi:hypothetical protein